MPPEMLALKLRVLQQVVSIVSIEAIVFCRISCAGSISLLEENRHMIAMRQNPTDAFILPWFNPPALFIEIFPVIINDIAGYLEPEIPVVATLGFNEPDFIAEFPEVFVQFFAGRQ